MKVKLPLAVRIALLLSGASIILVAQGQTGSPHPRAERFRPTRGAQFEGPSGGFDRPGRRTRPDGSRITEAPTGFGNLTNGYLPQGPAFDKINAGNVVALRSFNDNRFIFEEVETVADGLGPTCNAQSCRECHQNAATVGASQVTVHRIGRLNGDAFFESLGDPHLPHFHEFPG